ncbi:MAG TPA: hypothetical protein VEX86_01235 [Longimicrobium sp.]|nr:hypothetical protein [Longimicrobium sp.]
MALTEESIRQILHGYSVLAERMQERLVTVTDRGEAQRLIAELEAEQWAGSPLAADAQRLLHLFTRVSMDAMLANARMPKPPPMTVMGKPVPLDGVVPGTDEERALMRAKPLRQEIARGLMALERVYVDVELRLAPPPPPVDAGDPASIRPEDPEARAWLRSNPGDAPLAANAFDAETALAFVESLYAAGARRVVIASENILDEDPPYCDAIRVQLPGDPAARAAVLALTNAEAEGEGFDPEEDTGQDAVFLWWD